MEPTQNMAPQRERYLVPSPSYNAGILISVIKSQPTEGILRMQGVALAVLSRQPSGTAAQETLRPSTVAQYDPS